MKNPYEQAVEIIDHLIKLRIEAADLIDHRALTEVAQEIEITKRTLADYLRTLQEK